MVERIRSEFQYIREQPHPYMGVGLVGNNLRHWKAHIIGADDTPYSGGLFILDIIFVDEYPEVPPMIKFETPIYHPNISANGSICITILKEKWVSKISMSSIFNYIIGLMGNPNPDHPLRSDLAKLMKTDKAEFDRKAAEFTALNAM